MDAIASERVYTVVLFIALAMWLGYRMLATTFFGAFFVDGSRFSEAFFVHRLFVLCAFCELACIWREGYGKKDAVTLAVFGLLAFGLYRNGYAGMLGDAAVVFVARHCDIRRLLAFASVVVGVLLVVVIACSIVGVIPDVVLEQRGRTHPRHCLGFTYTLFPPQYLFALTCAICMLRDRKITWAEVAVLLVANLALMLLTYSRLSFALALAALVAVALRKLAASDGAWGKVSRVARWTFVAVVALSALAVGAYALDQAAGTGLLDALNGALGARIGFAYRGFVDMGTALFGHPVNWVGNGLDAHGNANTNTYNYVDNLFFHSLIECGWVYTLGLFALYTAVAWKMHASRDYFAVVVFALLALHFLLDDLCLMLNFNVLLLALGSYLAAGGSRLAGDKAAG